MTAATTQQKIHTAPATTPTGERRRGPWRKIVAVVACQVAALLCAEAVLAWTGIGEEEIFRFDQELGFVHIPNKRVTWRSEGYATSYFDANGLREKGITVAKPANTVRVALLGDSLTEGLQVNYEDSFAHLIEQRLGRTMSGKQLQVINFACSGYSTTQELLFLERQVLKFKPDLVLVCYNNRDLIENWSPTDQVVTNVRPMSVHLPGGYLFIDNLIVKRWFKSPRGSFLTRLAWIREHSRIWGVYSMTELQLSQKNPVAKALLNFWSNPKKTIADGRVSLADWWKNLRTNPPTFSLPISAVVASGKPAFSTAGPQIEHGTATPASAAAPATPAAQSEPLALLQTAQQPAAPKLSAPDPAEACAAPPVFEASPQVAIAPAATAPATAPVTSVTKSQAINSGQSTYRSVVFTTMSSLLGRMSADCTKAGGRLAVVAMPVRAVLCPTPEYEQEFSGITYGDEIAGLKTICAERDIPFCNVQTVAEKLEMPARERLYYTAHLTPEGHGFTAGVLEQFCRNLLSK